MAVAAPITSAHATLPSSDLEARLHQTLSYYNTLAKSLDINAPPPENVATHEIEAAKMLNYCVRMLHADGWHPPTVIRAMVLRESGIEASMKGTMYRALRERRKEAEVLRSQKEKGGKVREKVRELESHVKEEQRGKINSTAKVADSNGQKFISLLD